METKSNQGLSVKKSEDFSKWFSEVIEKADIVDLRLDIKGFMVFCPWGATILERIFRLFSDELENKGHKQTFMPTVIPEENLKKESSHIAGFTPEVFWLKEINKEKLALRPTSETLYTPMFKLWIRSHRDLPLKLYQRGSVFRLDTKATRPLIRTREILWIEAHDAFATKAQAESQVQEDIQITEEIMHKRLGIPFLPMKRPSWDKFAGAEYTIGSDVMMPDGKLIQQPSTHLMGQKFSRAFNATFKNEKGEEEFLWTTAYGPAMSRILASVIAMHGDDKGLILPSSISPVSVVIVPILRKENKELVIREANKIKEKIKELGLKVELDLSEKSPGEKFHIWELKGVPLRLEIGENEIKAKELTLFIRTSDKKEKIKISELKKLISIIEKYDQELLKKADNTMKGKIIDAKNKKEVLDILDKGCIARVNFCSTDEHGAKCAGIVEKEMNAEVRGTMANKKETASENCLICGKKATDVIYIGRSY